MSFDYPTCPRCETAILGVVTTGPSHHQLEPCGCRVSTLTARELAGDDRPRAMTDGGRLSSYERVTEELSAADGVIDATVKTDDFGHPIHVAVEIADRPTGTTLLEDEISDVELDLTIARISSSGNLIAYFRPETGETTLKKGGEN